MRALEEVGRGGIALQTLHELAGIGRHELRIFGVALVGAAPAVVLRHGHRGREGPFDAGGAHLLGGDARDVA